MKVKSIVIEFDDSDEAVKNPYFKKDHAKTMRFEEGRWHFDGPVQARYAKLAADLWDRVRLTIKGEE